MENSEWTIVNEVESQRRINGGSLAKVNRVFEYF